MVVDSWDNYMAMVMRDTQTRTDAQNNTKLATPTKVSSHSAADSILPLAALLIHFGH